MKLIKTEDEQGVMYSLSGDNLPDNYVLSKQNCDEIFGVVAIFRSDVEELSMKNDKGIYRSVDGVISYRQGFNKAMQLNKDKVFTLEDIRKAINYIFEQTVVFGNKVSALDVDKYIQSLQQPTEIEVTFNPDEKDSEGCLILKRVV
jgi:hypothetical protein